MRTQWLVPLSILWLGCRAAAPADSSADARAAIDAANAQWPRFTAGGHADSIARFFHANAVMYPPNMQPVSSRDSIRAFFALINGISTPPPTLTVQSEGVSALGPMAVEAGRWHFAFSAGTDIPPGVPTADSGHYLVHWVKEGDRWLMKQNVWNSSVPVERGR